MPTILHHVERAEGAIQKVLHTLPLCLHVGKWHGHASSQQSSMRACDLASCQANAHECL